MTGARRPAGREIPAEVRSLMAMHDRLQGEIRGQVDALTDVVANRHAFEAKRAGLDRLLAGDVLPHLRAEEDVVYPAGAALAALRPLVDALAVEDQALTDLADEIAAADSGFAAASAAYAFLALFEVHAQVHNDVVLPALIAGGARPAALLEKLRRAFVFRQKEAARAMDEHTEQTPATDSTIDTAGIAAHDGERVVDTRIDTADSCANLATTAVDSLGAGGSFVLVADHDPRGIDYMLRAERPGTTSWEVLEDGPTRWQVRIARTAAVA